MKGVAVDLVSCQRLVSEKTIYRSESFIGPALCYAIDTGAGKTRLCHIVGSDIYLDLVNGVQRDRLCSCLSAGCGRIEAEGVIEYGPVQRIVIVLSVAAGKRSSVIGCGSRGGEPGVIVCRPGDRGQLPDLGGTDIHGGAGAVLIE